LLRFLILLGGVLLMLVNRNFYEFSEQLQLEVFVVGLLLLGIPHGGADRLIAYKNFSYKSVGFSNTKFNLMYLGNMALFLAVLFCFPVSGFIIFLLFSAYHFGQSDLQMLSTQSIWGKVLVFNYGLLILGIIFLPDFAQVQLSILTLNSNVRTTEMLKWVNENHLRILVAIIFLFVLSGLLYFLCNNARSKLNYVQLFQNLGVIVILYNLPLLLSFSFYFLLWHSVFSLKSILKYLLKDKSIDATLVIKEIVRNSLIATLGIILCGLAGYKYATNPNLVIYAVLGLAVLTTSHMQIMHQMYNQVDVLSEAADE
jgi:Brp/Blh family beta-carotene 15,15'-monooxygenase